MEREASDRAESAAAAEERVDEAVQDVSPFKAWFGRVATKVSDAMGSPWAFTVAVAVILKDGRAYGLRALSLMFNESAPQPLTTLPGKPLTRERLP
jgi:hypothetical protein